MADSDLPAVLAVQAACYGDALLEPAEALASRLVLSRPTCWVACAANRPGTLSAYLFTHPWPAATLPPLGTPLPASLPPQAGELVWFVHDMAVAPAGRGAGLAARLYEAAREAAAQAGWHTSRLIAVQAAAPWWERLGYAPVAPAVSARYRDKLAAYGASAVLMERSLA